MATKKETNSENFSRTASTNYKRTYEASPFFEFSSPVITAIGDWVLTPELANRNTNKYLPFTNIRIVNNSSQNIAFFPNQQNQAINVPAGTIISFDRKSIPAITSLKLSNLGSSDTLANDIKISLWREGEDVDRAFERMHKAFYERFLFPKNRSTEVI